MNAESTVQADDLHIIIEALPEPKGEILIACFNSAEDWMNMERIFKAGCLPYPVSGNTAEFTFDNCPHGTYACCVLLDSNCNHKMDFNILGYPVEAFAFSRNAIGMFGPPDFEQAAFEHRGETSIHISLR